MKIKLYSKSALSVSHMVLPSPPATSVGAVESQSPLPLHSEICTTTLFPQSSFKHASYALRPARSSPWMRPRDHPATVGRPKAHPQILPRIRQRPTRGIKRPFNTLADLDT